ncbi:hypothetical protein C8J56DRAFT_956013 [Mycena floridula]|nr:hypothetical protein C8J56DRAFT_956013 [Mycena floridula]
MVNFYIYLRYALFGCFIVCNAIIASVAVWNISLAQVASMKFPVVAYLVFLGASSLAFIFTVIFIELARRNAVTSRVWFECLWTGFFSIMELAGAAAFSSTVPDAMCSKKANRLAGRLACTSTQALLAFTWICTILLLCYLLILSISSLLHHKHNPQIWHTNIHNFPAIDCGRLASAPPTPTLPRFINRAPTIVAPKPHRPQPVDLIDAYRSGLSPDYEIEHFQPANYHTSQPVPPIPAASTSQLMRGPATNYAANTFYSQVVQSSLIAQPAVAQRPNTTRRTGPSPPPLGNWPRADAIQQSASRPRKLPPSPGMADLSGSSPPSHAPNTGRRPAGPRKRSTSGENHRPEPLDLSKISSFRER